MIIYKKKFVFVFEKMMLELLFVFLPNYCLVNHVNESTNECMGQVNVWDESKRIKLLFDGS